MCFMAFLYGFKKAIELTDFKYYNMNRIAYGGILTQTLELEIIQGFVLISLHTQFGSYYSI